MDFIYFVTLHGEKELAIKLTTALAEGYYIEAARIKDQADGIIRNAPVLNTKIIEEGRIGYISINNLCCSVDSAFGEAIFAFYEEIMGFEHLIVDIRRNQGGVAASFIETIMTPNMKYAINVDAFVFLRIGEYNQSLTDLHRYRTHTAGSTLRAVSRVAGEGPYISLIEYIIESYYLPERNMDDMERMEYAFRTNTMIRARLTERFGYRPAFEGKIWLLTSRFNGSAAEYISRIVKNSGFATLVGERTGGNLSGRTIVVPLPNSGILFQFDAFYITDDRGRPFEAGTYPHIFNRPGYDALETVLQLIDEGAY